MELKLEGQAKIHPGQTETYMTFRSAVPKPANEDAHLRHILRFYMTRAMQKRGQQDIYVLPQATVGDKQIRVDVAAGSTGKYTFSVCEPGSVTPETENLLEMLKDDGLSRARHAGWVVLVAKVASFYRKNYQVGKASIAAGSDI